MRPGRGGHRAPGPLRLSSPSAPPRAASTAPPSPSAWTDRAASRSRRQVRAKQGARSSRAPGAGPQASVAHSTHGAQRDQRTPPEGTPGVRTPSPLELPSAGLQGWDELLGTLNPPCGEKETGEPQRGTRGSAQGPGARTRGLRPEDGGLFPRSSCPPRPRELGCALPPDLMFTSSRGGSCDSRAPTRQPAATDLRARPRPMGSASGVVPSQDRVPRRVHNSVNHSPRGVMIPRCFWPPSNIF